MIEKIKDIIPTTVYNELPTVIEKFQINTPLRLSHFLGQTAHESGDFKRVREGLNYSDVNRIIAIFKHDADLNHDHVISAEELENAKKYVHNPEGLANFVYANQNGNGNESSGDGFKFSGKGFIQLTGRTNYAEFDAFVPEDIISNPDLVATKYPLLSAGFFWNKHKLNSIADLGNSIDAVTKITKVINGGTIGLQERVAEFTKFYSKLSV